MYLSPIKHISDDACYEIKYGYVTWKIGVIIFKSDILKTIVNFPIPNNICCVLVRVSNKIIKWYQLLILFSSKKLPKSKPFELVKPGIFFAEKNQNNKNKNL